MLAQVLAGLAETTEVDDLLQLCFGRGLREGPSEFLITLAILAACGHHRVNQVEGGTTAGKRRPQD